MGELRELALPDAINGQTVALAENAIAVFLLDDPVAVNQN